MFEWLRRRAKQPGGHRATPESRFVVTLDEVGVECVRPDGTKESVAWSDLKAVVLETNDGGPVACDVYWLLVGASGGCVVPQGASGEEALLTRLQALPGFDNEALIAAMCSTENTKFLCWRADPAGQA